MQEEIKLHRLSIVSSKEDKEQLKDILFRFHKKSIQQEATLELVWKHFSK